MLFQNRAIVRLISLVSFVGLALFLTIALRREAPVQNVLASETFSETPDPDPAPIKVGEFEDIDVNILYEEEASWRQVIHYPNAAYIKVHFMTMDLLSGDKVTVSDSTGEQIYTYPGAATTADENGVGFWALSIVGDTAVIELHANQLENLDESAQGVFIDKYARGYPQDVLDALHESDTRSTCGTNQRTDVACYENSYPTEFDRSNAVARILINGASHCTGWRVSPGNLLFTNEHCITSQSELNQMEFWFNYQRPLCETGGTNTPTIVTGDDFLIDDFTLDFALVTLNDIATIQSFGYLELDPRTTTNGEELYIPQHGAGNPKEFGIDSDVNSPNTLCQVDINITNGRGTDTDVGYFCDTIGGSSGSPVLARSTHKVVALHHFGNAGAPNCSIPGNNVNRGARIELIWPLVESYFPDLKITKSADPSPIIAGNILTYNLNIQNGTESTLNGIEVTDTTPVDTTYVNGSATCGGSESGGVVTFPIGSLNSSAAIDCSFQVTVSGGLGSTVLFEDDMEGGTANWTTSHGDGSDDWVQTVSLPHSPTTAWVAFDVATVTDQYLDLTNPVALSSNSVLRFWHYYDTESGYDGGVVEISVDNGVNWFDLGSEMLQNGYNSSISTGYSSPIGGRDAFSGDSGGYLETSVDLSAYAGQNALIRFRMATDTSVSVNGWYVDDVSITNEDAIDNTACVTATGGANDCDSVRTAVEGPACPIPTSPNDVGIVALNPTTLQLAWTATGADYYDVWSAVNTPFFTPGADCGNPAPYNCSSVSINTFSDSILGTPNFNHSYIIVARNSCGTTGAPSSDRTGEFDFGLQIGTP